MERRGGRAEQKGEGEGAKHGRRGYGAAAAGAILAVAAAALAPLPAAAASIAAAVLRVDPAQPPLPISRLDLPPADLGLAGARLATEDNATTGRFMNQDFTLEEVVVATPEEAVTALGALLDQGVQFVTTLADADTTLALADAAGDRALVLNARAPDDRLRGADCRANLLHVAPSRAMLTDALTQYLATKRWTDWLLVEGSHPADIELGDAYRRSAEKFGATIVETRTYEDTGGARRTDSGHVQVQAQLPVFTQRAPDHDILVAADESEVFAAWLPYHTWDPRPVAGSAGLSPVSWHASSEAWGGTQLQTRFEKLASRSMRPEDYNAWLGLRSVGEAATRTQSAELATIRDYMLGPDFALAAFKGQPVSFRDWDGQIREPILLAAGDVVVSVSPQDEFVHQVSPLDTLGTDRPESECRR